MTPKKSKLANKTLRMVRKSFNKHSCGTIFFDDRLIHTIEKPEIINDEFPSGKPFYSAIPAGLYKILQHNSEKFGYVWALVNEELGVYHKERDCKSKNDRYAILIHAGNWAKDVVGCIAVGLGASKDGNMVTNSRDAIKYLNDHINQYTNLEITSQCYTL